jgi:hypothetical protein
MNGYEMKWMGESEGRRGKNNAFYMHYKIYNLSEYKSVAKVYTKFS